MSLIRLEQYIDTKNLDKMADLIDVLLEQRLNVKDTGIKYRVINHWDEKGIIHFARNGREGNRRFSFVDFIWIKIANELRSFGVKLSDIKKIKDELYRSIPFMDMMDDALKNPEILKILNQYKGEGKEKLLELLKANEANREYFADIKFTNLFMLVSEAILSRNVVSLVVFNDGECFPYIKANHHLYPEELLSKMEFSSQVRVSFTEIIFKHILEDFLDDYLNDLHLFTHQELKLLSYIKEGNYKTIEVLYKSKQKNPFTIKKGKKASEEIIKIIREREYREFVITDKKDTTIKIKD